jgi:hypothetical protein
MRSCLYEGAVVHRRLEPVPHRFRYRVGLVYLDLEELPSVFRGRWLWGVERRRLATFRRADHLGDPRVPLDRAVRDLVEARSGRRPGGPIALLTGLRYLGVVFNPVSFFYCFDPTGARVEAIVAEVTNTPWLERHCYVLARRSAAGRGPLRARTPKEFHVSPFQPMEQEYDWRFDAPGERLRVAITNRACGRPVFRAALALERRPLDARGLARALVRHPFASGAVAAAIYWQAFRLALRGAPFHAHPASRAPAPPSALEPLP